MRLRIVTNYFLYDDTNTAVPLHTLFQPTRGATYLAGQLVHPTALTPVANVRTYNIQDVVFEYNVKPGMWIVTECCWYKLTNPDQNYHNMMITVSKLLETSFLSIQAYVQNNMQGIQSILT